MLSINDGGAFRRLARNLKALDPALDARLKQNNAEAGQVIVDAGKSAAMARGGVARKSAASLRSNKQAARVAVTMGGARFPYALGAEFGSKQYAQFNAWRGTMKGDAFGGSWGYFLGPAIRQNQERIMTVWERGMDALLEDAFPPTI